MATYLPITLGGAGAVDCQIASAKTACSPGHKIIVDSTNEANIIFNSSSANDASLKLAGQLLATKLGIKAGKGDATCLNSAGTIAAADNALTAYGYNTKPTGAARQTDLSLSSQLEYWNRTGTCL